MRDAAGRFTIVDATQTDGLTMGTVEGGAWRSAADVFSGFGGLAVNLWKSVVDFVEKQRAAKAHWRFDVDVGLKGNSDPYRNARVTWRNDPAFPADIKGVAIKQVEGFTLVPAGRFSEKDEPPINLYPATQRASAELAEADLYKRAVEEKGVIYAEAWFFILVPTRPREKLGDLTSLDVSVTYEEDFGKRSPRRIVLRSEKMLWATRSVDRTA